MTSRGRPPSGRLWSNNRCLASCPRRSSPGKGPIGPLGRRRGNSYRRRAEAQPRGRRCWTPGFCVRKDQDFTQKGNTTEEILFLGLAQGSKASLRRKGAADLGPSLGSDGASVASLHQSAELKVSRGAATPFPVTYCRDTCACLDSGFKASESSESLFAQSMGGSRAERAEGPCGPGTLSAAAKDNKHRRTWAPVDKGV